MKKEKKEVIDLYKKQTVANIFDKNRSKYAFQKYKHKIESKIILKNINKIPKQNLKILDVACGTGRFLQNIFSSKKNIEYFGIDTSRAMSEKLKEKARKLGKRVHIINDDAEKLPFPDENFDLTYTFHLLWHLPKKEQKQIISEMLRVTKKGGIILFDTLNSNFVYQKIKNKKDTKGIYKLNLDDIKDFLKERNYKINKLNDIIIKNDFLYNLFNILNKLNIFLPKNFFHMFFIEVVK